mgnify:CR=1 FL=1
MKKINWKAIIPYILIPALCIGVLYMYMERGATKELKYYEVLAYFDNQQVVEADLNMNSGAMTFKLKDDKTQYKYTVPNVNLFLSDVHEDVREYNKANPDKPIELNYKAGTSNSWFISVLPSLLLTLGFVVLMVVMFRKMNSSISSENNKAMSFGKARIKRGDEQTKKVTFKGNLHEIKDDVKILMWSMIQKDEKTRNAFFLLFSYNIIRNYISCRLIVSAVSYIEAYDRYKVEF